MSIYLLLLFLLALDDGSMALILLRRRPNDVHRLDLDWHLTIAHPSIATGLGVLYVQVDGGVTQKKPLT